jgi:hypothetical protein
VAAEATRLVGALGPELTILREIPLDDLRRVGGTRFAEAVARLRRGEVIPEAGYDGEYGTIRLFGADEADGSALFARTDLAAPAPADKNSAERTGLPAAVPTPRARRGDATPAAAAAQGAPPAGTGSVLDGLDPEQRGAASTARERAGGGPVAVPGLGQC